MARNKLQSESVADPGHFKYMPVYGSLMILCEV